MFGSQLLGAAGPANPIERENGKPGTAEWQLRDQARLREIEGYASATSVNRGEQIGLLVSTIDPVYSLEIFRMGWYSGLGARRVFGPVERNGIRQVTPAAEPESGLIECHWVDPLLLTIRGDPTDPTEWASGVYLVKLTARPSGKQSYIVFAVRDDARPTALLFQMSVTTYQAYNNWPGTNEGKSLYAFNSSAGQPARRVSFNRPYTRGAGAMDFIVGWEYNMVRFLEREGYDLTYATNLDTHRNGSLLQTHRGFLSVGHDEYWTKAMRDHVESARDQGVSLGFFSANTCYWQIRLEPDKTGEPDRTIVAYKEAAMFEDPVVTDGDPLNDHLATGLWRGVPVNRPEEALIGVMFVAQPVDGDIVIDNPTHWVFAHTGLQRGDKLPGLLGYEVDRMFGSAPPGTARLAHSPFVATDDGETGFSDMTVYTAESGATVFATGSIQWSWGLDDFNHQIRGRRENSAARQITRNVLNRMIYEEPPPRRRSARR